MSAEETLETSGISSNVNTASERMEYSVETQNRFTGMTGEVIKDGGDGNWTAVSSKQREAKRKRMTESLSSVTSRSVVDYVLCKPNLIPHFSSFSVHDPNILSDHCELSFSLSTKVNINDQNDPAERDFESRNVEFIYKWNDEKLESFKISLTDDLFASKLDTLTNELQNVMDTENLEENLSTFYEEIGNICDPLFKRNIQHGTTSTNTSKMNNKWYDGECTEKRKEFFSHLNNYRTNESAENRSSMTKSQTEYKSLLRSKRYHYDKHETEKLVQARYKNAKLYWNMLKNSQNGKNTSLNVSLSQFEQYFKSINNPESVFYQEDDETEYFNN